MDLQIVAICTAYDFIISNFLCFVKYLLVKGEGGADLFEFFGSEF